MVVCQASFSRYSVPNEPCYCSAHEFWCGNEGAQLGMVEQWHAAGVSVHVQLIIRTPRRQRVVPCVVIRPPNWLSGRFESNPAWPLEFGSFADDDWTGWLQRPCSRKFYELCKVVGCCPHACLLKPCIQMVIVGDTMQSFDKPTTFTLWNSHI